MSIEEVIYKLNEYILDYKLHQRAIAILKQQQAEIECLKNEVEFLTNEYASNEP